MARVDVAIAQLRAGCANQVDYGNFLAEFENLCHHVLETCSLLNAGLSPASAAPSAAPRGAVTASTAATNSATIENANHKFI